MRKIILTCLLAIAGSVWMMSEAACFAAYNTLTQPFKDVTGTLQAREFPCEEGEECPPCMTVALVTQTGTFYLTALDPQIQMQLDSLELHINERARIAGTPFTHGSYNFIQVSSISIGYPLISIPSLCDEWNILSISFPDGHDYFRTFTQHLTTDTLIDGVPYLRLEQNGLYLGALREENARIYYVPNWAVRQYLLYAFDAKEGDKLSNLWYGGRPEWCPNGYNATVKRISNTTPREFTIEVEYIFTDSDGEHIEPWTITWIEGVGMTDGPVGTDCPGPDCACSCGQRLLCAYKNGEQVYVSNTGEGFGCYYDSKQEAINKLLGKWYLYHKEDVIGNYWNEQGELVYGSREMELNGDFTYTFTDSTVLIGCPTCYSAPQSYTMEYNGRDRWLLTVPGIFDTPYSSDPSVSGFSPITILQLNNQQIIWEYTIYGGDEGPETHHQFLLRNNPNDNSSDTIPLYIKDGPGSSTVEPVDPNEVVATLKGDELSVREYINTEITMTLTQPSSNNLPARAPAGQIETFLDSISVHLTQEGTYSIQLSNPEWDYIIVGMFDYKKSSQSVGTTDAGTPVARKILRDGQLLLQIGDRIYTITGALIQ